MFRCSSQCCINLPFEVGLSAERSDRLGDGLRPYPRRSQPTGLQKVDWWQALAEQPCRNHNVTQHHAQRSSGGLLSAGGVLPLIFAAARHFPQRSVGHRQCTQGRQSAATDTAPTGLLDACNACVMRRRPHVSPQACADGRSSETGTGPIGQMRRCMEEFCVS